MISDKIIETAKKYIGKREIPNNQGFLDSTFQKKMQDVGWLKGHAWCSYFCELVWKEAYQDDKKIVAEINKLFSASATATYKNFELAGGWVLSSKPAPGALAVWRQGVDWRGHIGIVTEVVDKNTFKSIEGNTNEQGGREGIEVARKVRLLNQPFKPKGLNVVGFILPK